MLSKQAIKRFSNVLRVRGHHNIKVGERVIAKEIHAPGGKQAVSKWTIEIDGEAKPACVAEWVTRFLA